MIQAAILDRAVVRVAGPEARSFLQGLITNDIGKCAPGTPIYAALLTPQGKVLFDFIVADGGSGFLFDCAAGRADDLVKRLSMYRLRAKLEIARMPELCVAALWGDGLAALSVPALSVPDGVIAFADPRLAALGRRLIGTRPALETALAAAGAKAGNAAAYGKHRLALGVPGAADFGADSLFALDAGLEELHGVDFKKGCYVGQELTARMKHRGTARKRILIAETSGEIPASAPVAAGGREIGNVLAGGTDRALALVRLDRLADAEEKNVTIAIAGHAGKLLKPAWFGR